VLLDAQVADAAVRRNDRHGGPGILLAHVNVDGNLHIDWKMNTSINTQLRVKQTTKFVFNHVR
jgi:hypothetical protein